MPRKRNHKGRPVTILGVQYSTIQEAAAALGLHKTTLARRLRDGWPTEEAIGQKPHKRMMPGKVLRYRGKTFPSIKSLAELIGVRPSTLRVRMAKGRSVEEAVNFEKRHPKHRSKPITFAGRRFESGKALAEFHGQRGRIVGGRLKRGWTMPQALGLEAPPPRFRDYQGHAREQHWKKVQVIDGRRLPAASSGEYRLYLITNIKNGKQYVGITTNKLGDRLRGHFALARKGRKSHLYNAMRKYGRSAFKIELLRNDAKDFAELQRQEVEEITTRGTIRHGYNSAAGGSLGTSKAIAVGNLRFPSRNAAATHYGIDAGLFNIRLKKLGWTPEQAAELQPPPKKPRRRIAINGESFPNLAAAARARGLDYGTVHARLTAHGWTIGQALGLEPPPSTVRSAGVRIEVGGKSYPSMNAAARAFKINPESLRRRIQAGMATEDAIRDAVQVMATIRRRRKTV